MGQLALDHFPFQAWSELVARHGRKVRASAMNYGDPMGSMSFRETIAGYLRTSRAVHCEARQIMVVSGSQQALELCARVLLDPGDAVWIEEPGYEMTRVALSLRRMPISPRPGRRRRNGCGGGNQVVPECVRRVRHAFPPTAPRRDDECLTPDPITRVGGNFRFLDH